jgi:hypothetical protein
MPALIPLHIVWSGHARERELQRCDIGISLPSIGSIIRLFNLGLKAGRGSWVLQTRHAYLFGSVFPAPDYDVFLIRTVIRPRTIRQAPYEINMYTLAKVYEQGTEGDEAREWEGFNYHPTLPGQLTTQLNW